MNKEHRKPTCIVSHKICKISLAKSTRMLGVLLNPTKDNLMDHLKFLKLKVDTFACRIQEPHLTENNIMIFHQLICIPVMSYTLAVVAANEEELARVVHSQISRAILQKKLLHIRSTIPTDVRYLTLLLNLVISGCRIYVQSSWASSQGGI
jgi:hypothetical protein